MGFSSAGGYGDSPYYSRRRATHDMSDLGGIKEEWEGHWLRYADNLQRPLSAPRGSRRSRALQGLGIRGRRTHSPGAQQSPYEGLSHRGARHMSSSAARLYMETHNAAIKQLGKALGLPRELPSSYPPPTAGEGAYSSSWAGGAYSKRNRARLHSAGGGHASMGAHWTQVLATPQSSSESEEWEARLADSWRSKRDAPLMHALKLQGRNACALAWIKQYNLGVTCK